MGRLKSLDVLTAGYEGCHRCELSAGRSRLVHWRGNPRARLFIIGEAPGAREDASGLPFVGPAGRKLDEALRTAGLDPAEDVFIANTVACRPPGNRQPEREEIRACSPRLLGMLGIIRPRVALLLGAVAAKLAGITSLKQWRGTKTEWDLTLPDGSAMELPVICSWHPAHVLRADGPEPSAELAADIRTAWSLAHE